MSNILKIKEHFRENVLVKLIPDDIEIDSDGIVTYTQEVVTKKGTFNRIASMKVGRYLKRISDLHSLTNQNDNIERISSEIKRILNASDYSFVIYDNPGSRIYCGSEVKYSSCMKGQSSIVSFYDENDIKGVVFYYKEKIVGRCLLWDNCTITFRGEKVEQDIFFDRIYGDGNHIDNISVLMIENGYFGYDFNFRPRLTNITRKIKTIPPKGHIPYFDTMTFIDVETMTISNSSKNLTEGGAFFSAADRIYIKGFRKLNRDSLRQYNRSPSRCEAMKLGEGLHKVIIKK